MADKTGSEWVAVTPAEWQWLEFYRSVVEQLGRTSFILEDVSVTPDKVRGKVFAYVETAAHKRRQ